MTDSSFYKNPTMAYNSEWGHYTSVEVMGGQSWRNLSRKAKLNVLRLMPNAPEVNKMIFAADRVHEALAPRDQHEIYRFLKVASNGHGPLIMGARLKGALERAVEKDQS